MKAEMAKKKPLLAAESMPTVERLKHAADFEENDARGRKHKVITILDPFAAAHRRGDFTDLQYGVGQKFHRHFHEGCVRGALASVSFDRVMGGAEYSLMPKTEQEAHHRQQYRNAEKLLGMETTALLRWIICDGETFQEAGARLGWRDRCRAVAAAVERMRAALDQLQELWGI